MSGPRILIVKTSSMGDVVHALPLATDIARAHPAATIDWAVEEGFGAIPRLHPAVSNVIAVALRRWRKSLASGAIWREMNAVRHALRRAPYDAIIDCQGLVKSALVARCARGPHCGFDRGSAREPLAAFFYSHKFAVGRSLHAIDRNRALGAAVLGYAVQGAPRFGLRVPSCTQPQLAELMRAGPYAVLLTNASRATKLWPAESWAALAARLAQHGLRSLLFWGSDAERVQTERRAAGMQRAVVAPRATLDDIAAVLAQARIVIGLDTGLSHLAAAVGAPTVGIYCDYDPALVGIVGDARCASLGGVDRAPTADDIIAAAESILGGDGSP